MKKVTYSVLFVADNNNEHATHVLYSTLPALGTPLLRIRLCLVTLTVVESIPIGPGITGYPWEA